MSCFYLDFAETLVSSFNISLYILHSSLLSSYYSLCSILSFATVHPLNCHSHSLSSIPPSLSHPLSLHSHHVSRYFDEEQDDYEYPYYHEETTQAPPSIPPETLANQVKRENLRSKTEKRG